MSDISDEEIALAEKAMTCLALELPVAVYEDAIEKIIRPTFTRLRSAATQARDAGYDDGVSDAILRMDGADNSLWSKRERLISYVGGLLKSTPARETKT